MKGKVKTSNLSKILDTYECRHWNYMDLKSKELNSNCSHKDFGEDRRFTVLYASSTLNTHRKVDLSQEVQKVVDNIFHFNLPEDSEPRIN